MRRIALAVLFSTVFAAQAARANDVVAAADKATEAVAADTVKDVAAETTDNATIAPPLRLTAPKRASVSGRATLLSLHAGLAGLQGYDVYSTTKALKSGAVEMNPFVKNTVGNRAAFIGLKVAMTAGPILAAEKMWREHHRVQAVAMMALANGMMAFVARHNAAVIANARR